eukprot:6802573-Prymnesium_polylepis.2
MTASICSAALSESAGAVVWAVVFGPHNTFESWSFRRRPPPNCISDTPLKLIDTDRKFLSTWRIFSYWSIRLILKASRQMLSHPL